MKHAKSPDSASEKSWWLDDQKNVDKIVYALIAACVLLQLGDLLIHPHGYFEFEHWFGFYGFYGFVACVSLVIAATGLRRLLMRPEDYYESDFEDSADE